MFTKISVAAIIKDHILTLNNKRTGKTHYPDIFLFFFSPAIASSLLIWLGVLLNDGLVNALITSFSIFSALLFNLLLLVYGIAEKGTNDVKLTDQLEAGKVIHRRKLLREVYINVSFSILISTLTIAVLLTYFLRISNCFLVKINICSFQWLLAAIIYYLSIQFLLTMSMILKRIYKLLAKAFDSNITS